MSIYKTAIQKPVTTALIFVAVVVIGLFAFSRLPIDQFPEMDPPFVTVMTTYPGANASEVETNVTKLVENALNSADGLKELTSNSKDNVSVVTLEMEWGTNLDEATNDVRSYIDMMKDNLPEGCSTPMIFKLNTSMMPVMQYYVTAKESYPGLDKILNDEVVTQLNRVDGIGTISLSGAPDRYVYVDIDQSKLDTYGISLEMVGSAISGSNLNLSSGTVKMEKEQYQLQVRSEFEESSEIEDLVVTTTPTGKIFIRDIATVRDTIKDLTLDEKVNGKEAVRMMISKKSGANTVQVCDDVRKELAKIEKTLPSDIEIGLIYDSSDDIKGAINSLEESILYALVFVVLVVLLFLGKWRATFIIGITIPISLIVAFIYLLFVDSSLNIISLSSLTVAIGMVVDDAIVVLENITTHIERGSNPREAAIYATNEVWTSVIATTLVIVAVFVPLTMLTGLAGILFKELGWIVTIVVCTSTTVAITLTPMLCSQMLKARKVSIDEKGHLVQHEAHKGWYQKYVVGTLDKIDSAYGRLLGWCLSHKRATVAIAVAFFIASILPMAMGKIGTDFMQSGDNGRVNISIELQRGTRIDETLKTARSLESRIYELVPEVKTISTSAGSNDDAGISALFSSTSNNKISMTVVCGKKNTRKRSIDEIAEVIRKELATYPEIIEYQCQSSAGMGMGGASTVDIEVYGYDFDQTNIYAEELTNAIKKEVPGARDIHISRDKDRPELKIVLDKEKLSAHGLNSSTVSMYLRNRVNGMAAGYLKEDGDEYDILVRLMEKDRNSITKVENLTIPTATGKNVKLSEVASIEEYWAPPTIERKSRQRYLRISVLPYQVSLGEMAQQVQRVINKNAAPTGIVVRIAGDYEDQQETFGNMIILLLLIVMLVYVVMASQFESLSKPGIIMMSVPFAISGVVLALWVTGTSLDMIGALGFIMLVGIVVKNGIVLVDYINLMRDRGYELKEAIVLSGESRIRPVLMTAFTTLLGMLPMALSNGDGSEMWRPMGIVVIGGLLVSTFVTLIIVPVVYAIMSRQGERDKEEKHRKEYIFMQLSPDEDNQ
ncbi:MAG: efflux RND transporter permease subunit [Bacteroidales bacterium]|nr:efflux RND transporter permease subunit [Candidatus Cacconaster merdequi]